MVSSRARDGNKIGDRGNEALPQSVVQLLKTQDAGYIRTTLQKTRKERQRLEQEIQIAEGRTVLALKGGKAGGTLVTFVDSRHEQEAYLQEAEAEDDEDDDAEEDEGSDEDTIPVALTEAQREERRIKKKRIRGREVRRNLLEVVKERENELVLAEQELEVQRAKMSNSVGGVNKNGVKFKIRERKR